MTSWTIRWKLWAEFLIPIANLLKLKSPQGVSTQVLNLSRSSIIMERDAFQRSTFLNNVHSVMWRVKSQRCEIGNWYLSEDWVSANLLLDKRDPSGFGAKWRGLQKVLDLAGSTFSTMPRLMSLSQAFLALIALSLPGSNLLDLMGVPFLWILWIMLLLVGSWWKFCLRRPGNLDKSC